MVRGERPVPTNSKDNPRKSEQIFSSQCQQNRPHPSNEGMPQTLGTDDLATKTASRTRVRSKKKWWSLTGSNRRHPACKAGALPAELRPRIPYGFIVSASSAQFQSKPFTSHNPSGEARKHDSASATFGRARAVPAFVRMRSAREREQMVGLRRLELLTPRLSSVCSNQLSYRP